MEWFTGVHEKLGQAGVDPGQSETWKVGAQSIIKYSGFTDIEMGSEGWVRVAW
jgi:hypothetical protein